MIFSFFLSILYQFKRVYFCDGCQESSISMFDIKLHGLMGWEVCESCIDKFHENKKHYCLPKGKIFKSFHDGKFNVMRSSGIIEKGWYIQEPVVRYGIGTGYTCRDT